MGWFIMAIIMIAAAVAAVVVTGVIRRRDQSARHKYEVELAEYKDKTSDRYRFSSSPREPQPNNGFIIGLRWAAAGFAAIALWFFLASTVYTQTVGEAKVFVDVSGKVVGQDIDSGWGIKAPWVEAVDFDLFSQEVVYAGGDTAPSYTGGTINGKEVTVSVGGVDGGSTQANVDMSVVYSLDATKVTDIFEDWRGQERFTKSIIEKTILSVARQVPASYTAIEFRGEKRGEAADRIAEGVLAKLKDQGIEDVLVNIQNITFSENVQAALDEVENANQAVQKARAEQEKVKVEAETARIKAQGVADANNLLNTSLTPEILQQKYIDALKEGTVYVVPDGSTPFIGTK